MLLAAGAAAKQKYGAFIQDTTGKLWTAEEWDGSATPNGIAVRDRNSGPSEGILLAIKSSLNYQRFSTKYIALPVAGCDIISAIKDYEGYEHTQAYLSQSSYLPALNECVDYRFPDGQSGYLGAVGEIRLIYLNRAEIEKCFSALGMTFPSMPNTEYVWSSTPSETTTSVDLYVWAPSVVKESYGYPISTLSRYVWPIGKVGDWSK